MSILISYALIPTSLVSIPPPWRPLRASQWISVNRCYVSIFYVSCFVLPACCAHVCGVFKKFLLTCIELVEVVVKLFWLFLCYPVMLHNKTPVMLHNITCHFFLIIFGVLFRCITVSLSSCFYKRLCSNRQTINSFCARNI